MSRSYFRVASVALAVIQVGGIACSRSDGNRSGDDRPSGAIHPRAEQRGHRRAIGGGPRDMEDGGSGTRERDDRDLLGPGLDPGSGMGTGVTPFGIEPNGVEEDDESEEEPSTTGSSRSGTSSGSSSSKTSGSRL